MGVKSSILVVVGCISFSLIIFSCVSKDASTIKGNAEAVGGKTIYLERTEPLLIRLLDSTKAKSNGDFSFNVEIPSEPYFLTIRTDSLLLGTLLVDKGEQISFRYANGEYEVEGSEGSARLKELNNMVSKTTYSRDSILQTLMPNNENLTEVNREMVKLLTKYKQNSIRFIILNTKSFASIAAIFQEFSPGYPLFGKPEDAPYYQILIDSLQTKYTGSAYIESLKTSSKALRSQAELQNKIDNITSVQDFPELSLPDKFGKEIKLSSLKEKTILLYFWATTMEGSQLDNRELLNLYEKYQSKGLEIYHVSLDSDRTRWIKAIETQQLPWINVCDGRGASSSAALIYNIQALPSNFIIDKNGDIVASNLFGSALEKRLAGLMQ